MRIKKPRHASLEEVKVGLARIKWRDIYSVLAMSTSNATGER